MKHRGNFANIGSEERMKKEDQVLKIEESLAQGNRERNKGMEKFHSKRHFVNETLWKQSKS